MNPSRLFRASQIALIATAHYLARVMYALLRRGELWQEKVAA